MSSIALGFANGLLLGLGVAVPIGPVNIEIIRRNLGQGFRAGMLLGLGACSIDTVYILLISFGLIAAEPSAKVQAVLLLVGAIILLALAGMTFRSAIGSARRAAAMAAGADQHDRPWRHYAVGLLMTATNPMNVIFWLGVVTGGLALTSTALGRWPQVAGVLCGTIAWVAGLNLALLAGRRTIAALADRRTLTLVLLIVNVVGGLILLAFAALGFVKFAAMMR